MKITASKYALAVWFTLICIISFGCASVRLISDYNEETDRQLSLIRSLTAEHIDRLKASFGSGAASFDSSRSFYETIDREIEVLEFRASSIPDNAQTAAVVTQVRQVILGNGSDSSSLRGIHALPANRLEGIDRATLSASKRIIDQTISAALTLELAKKCGEK